MSEDKITVIASIEIKDTIHGLRLMNMLATSATILIPAEWLQRIGFHGIIALRCWIIPILCIIDSMKGKVPFLMETIHRLAKILHCYNQAKEPHCILLTRLLLDTEYSVVFALNPTD